MGLSLTRRGAALLATATLMLVLAAVSSSTAMFVFGTALISVLAAAWRVAMCRADVMSSLDFQGLPRQTETPFPLALSEPTRVVLRVMNRTGSWVGRLRWEIAPHFGWSLRVDSRGWVPMPPAAVLELPVHLTGIRVGTWLVDGLVGISEDRLGLVVVRCSQRLDSRVEVLPAGHALVARTEDAPTPRSGERATRAPGEGGLFRELRGWQPGDGVRRIAWRATARRGTPIVRSFVDERIDVRLLLMDAAPSMREGRPVARMDAAIVQAWSLIESWAAAGDVAGVQSFVDRPIGGLRPAAGPLHYAACAAHILALANLPHDAISDWTDDELAMMLSLHLLERRNLTLRSADGHVASDADLFMAWLEQRFGVECERSEARLMSAGFSLSGRRFARLLVRAGWPLPVRVGVRPAARELALTALLVEATTLPRGSHVHVVSDLFEAAPSDSLTSVLQRLVGGGCHVHLHIPWAPWFASTGRDLAAGQALHSVFASTYGRTTRPVLESLRQQGVKVSVFGQPPSVG